MALGSVEIRLATKADLAAIVGLHAADILGGHGDVWSAQTRPLYEQVFEEIEAHPDHHLYVACLAGQVVGTFMLSRLPGLTGLGRPHVELRSVQVDQTRRSMGIGAQLVSYAEQEAQRMGAASLDLTSNMKRVDAHRFYERLGFAKSHAGFKKKFV
jgi:GNAT superfamily N-acetyltransferase